MKVAVITRHAVANYGSLLQTMATQQVLQNLGHQCQIIDYVRRDESYREREFTLLRRKPDWYNNPIKRALYLALRQPESILTGRKFEKAQKAHLHLTQRYSDAEQLQKNPPKADVYLTGSDQVWGPVEDGSYDSSYCLGFAAEEDKKVSYAASFGHTQMTPQLQDYYRKWLSRYQHLAVREDSAVALLQGMGLQAEQVLDPTLLMERQQWEPYLTRLRKKPYVLVYQLHNDKKLSRYAKQVAKAKGLPLVRVSAALHQCFRGGKFRWAPEIGEFLSLIRNAQCMITDSFHGTAFAILFNTPFVEVLPNNNTGTRNQSILTLTGLSGRILREEDDIALAMEKMDFSHANQVIAVQRERSLQILRKMLEA